MDKQIKALMLNINSPLLSIPGISYTLGSIILAEIGNVENFSNPAKLLAFAGLETSTHQSGKYAATSTPMVKRGSSYLRWAVLQAALLVMQHDPTFKSYATKKENEGKHHFVVLSHVGRKLVRVIFHLLKNNVTFGLPFNHSVFLHFVEDFLSCSFVFNFSILGLCFQCSRDDKAMRERNLSALAVLVV